MGTRDASDLHIELDSQNIASGDSISGKVCLHLKQPAKGNSLKLRLKGKEEVQWVTERNGSSYAQQDRHCRKQTFPCSEYQLASFSCGFLPAGQYCYPFSIRTQTTMSASLFAEANDITAEIRYVLKASIEGQDAIAEAKVPLRVTRDINPLDGVETTEEQRLPVRSCFCLQRGELGLTVFLDKDAYFPGDTASVDVKVDNRASWLPVTRLKVRIYRELVVLDSPTTSLRAHTVVGESSVKTAIPSGKSLLSTQSVQLKVLISEQSGKAFSAPSATGKLLRCRYYLAVQAQVGGWLCSSVVTPLVQNFSVFQKRAAEAAGKSTPGDWNPTVLPLTTFE